MSNVRFRLVLALGALGCALLLYLLLRSDAPRAVFVGGEGYRAAVLNGSGEASERPELALDGRRAGNSAYAFRHATSTPELQLNLTFERELRGIVVSWDGAAPKEASVVIKGRRHALRGAEEGESWVFLGSPQATTSLSIVYAPTQGCAGIAEVGLIEEGTAVWLLAPRKRADVGVAMLAAYGVPSVARVPAAALSALQASQLLRGDERWVISNDDLGEEHRAMLRAMTEAGAWLVELGPLPSVCDERPLVSDDSTSHLAFTLKGAGLDRARLIGRIARVPACGDPDCEEQVIATASERDAPGVPVTFISKRQLGRGACVRFFADITSAIVRLRQGNPDRISAAPASEGIFKPGDLFVGDLEQGDYAVPSADRLGAAITSMITRAPGPDLLVHSLPTGSAGLVVYTLDQDYVPAPAVLALSEEAQSVGLTITLTDASLGGKADVVFEQSDPGLMPERIALDLAAQHELGIHPNLVGVAPGERKGVLVNSVAAFREAYGVPPRVVRNHHLVWEGTTEMAEQLEAAGLALDLSFVTAAGARGYEPGFMTGSGLPLPFIDTDGRLLAIMQQATHLDDYVLAVQGKADGKLVAELVAHADRLILLAAAEHVPLVVLHHPAWWFETKGAFQKALLATAHARGHVVWGAGRWLRFVEQARSVVVARKNGKYTLRGPDEQVSVLLDRALVETIHPQAARPITRGGEEYAVVPMRTGLAQQP